MKGKNITFTMLRRFNAILLLLLLSCTIVSAKSKTKNYELASPDGKLTLTVNTAGGLNYSLQLNDQKLLDKSAIALELADGTKWNGADKSPKVKKSSVANEEIVSPLYRVESFTTEYNEMNLKFKDFGVIFRAYNSGASYRFYSLLKEEVTILNEVAQFNVEGDRESYAAMSTGKKDIFACAFQNIYTVNKISKLPKDDLAFLPLSIAYDGETKLTILEADLESYPGMFLKSNGTSFNSVFAKYPSKLTEGDGRAMTKVAAREEFIAKINPLQYMPWRVLAVTESDTQMPVNNLVYALASPNRIGDYSWVEGGQSVWEWWNDWGISKVSFNAGINMESYKHYIDFAAENNIKFVTIDEGWYTPKSGDMMAVIPELDIKELVEYGKNKGVGIVLWCVFNVLDDNLESICDHYSKMGVKGFKVDFLDRDDQTAVEMVYRIAKEAAKHKLVLDYHGIYKPTGLNRTYPNVINIESVFGMEEVKWSNVDKNMPLYDVTFPYIRMMAGSVDFTPGAMRNATKGDFKPIYRNPMSMGTRAHQIATYVVYDSPFTMLADNTTAYRAERESLDFITSIPATGVLDTKILQGKLGEYIISAREFEQGWFIGGLTNWDAREVTLDFSFLKEGKYKVAIFKDGVNAHKVAEDYILEEVEVTNSSKITIKMASGGGFAARVTALN